VLWLCITSPDERPPADLVIDANAWTYIAIELCGY